MNIEHATILITGADNPLGIALIRECIRKGAKKIYAASLSSQKIYPLTQQYPGMIIPLVLDVTDDKDIIKAGGTCHDINMLINNTGIALQSSFLEPDASLKALFEMKVNYIGILEMINRFLPVLRKNQEAGIVNILAAGSAPNVNRLRTYCATKSAGYILTHAIRAELRAERIHVFGIYPGYVHTELSGNIFFEIVDYNEIAANICTGIEAGHEDIFPDDVSRKRYDEVPVKIPG